MSCYNAVENAEETEVTSVKLSYLDLHTTDPAWNLAMEQVVFDRLPRDRAYVMLWQNDNAIIIGKHQNALAEIDRAYVDAHGIRVVRRLSGGGAVYHDMGNLNFTFITDAADTEHLNFRLFCQPVVDTLAALGVRAEVNGRNDITIDGRKFSGNSQYIRQGRVMHHGTILFDSDLDVVNHALRVDPAKIRSKGVASVRSRVTNVRPYLPEDVDLPTFRALLLQSILSETPGEPYALTEDDLAAVEELRRTRYGTSEWNYGSSPRCTVVKKQRIEGCGTVEVYLTVDRGVITDAAFRGDFFSAAEPEELAQHLTGLRPQAEEYAHALERIDVGRYFAGMTNRQFLELLCK